MHISLSSKPSGAAAFLVYSYIQRVMQEHAEPLVHPVPARAAQMLSFQFGDPVGVRFYGTDCMRKAEEIALIGPQTHQRCQLVHRGYVETFAIVFRPSAIYRLFRLPAIETVNRDQAARAVLGARLSALREELGNATTFWDRVNIANAFIIERNSQTLPASPIDLVASEIRLHHGACRIDSLVKDTGMSMRTFQRTFQQRIGMPPKLYSRIVRFESALKLKASAPQLSWKTVSHEFGYHDQMHLIHDFRQLSGETPEELLSSAEPVLRPQMKSAEPGTDLITL